MIRSSHIFRTRCKKSVLSLTHGIELELKNSQLKWYRNYKLELLKVFGLIIYINEMNSDIVVKLPLKSHIDIFRF